MKNVSTIFLGATLLSVAACGNNSGNSAAPSTSNPLLAEAGHYEAKLSPLNAHLGGDASGTALVKVRGDDFTVEVKVNGSTAQIPHGQSIHISDSCPTLASDVNKDGIIDAVEGIKSYGAAIIPLDGDLKVQVENNQKFPTSDFSGNYFYHQAVSLIEMMKDLFTKDADTQDHVVKLKSNMGLAGRQVVIYGVASDVALPETVAALGTESKNSSLPIACGSLVKIAVTDEGPNTNGGKD